MLAHAHRSGRFNVRVLIIGSDQFASRVARSIVNAPVPCLAAAYVQLSGQEIAVAGAPVIGIDQMEKIGTLAKDVGIDDVIIAVPPARFGEIPSIMRWLAGLALPVRMVMDFGTRVVAGETMLDIDGLPVLDLTVTPADSVVYMVAKRAFDLVFSTLALVLFAPLMLFIAVAILLTSPGPIIFEQERVGLDGRIFRMFKFRTMRQDNPGESETRWTTANDPRRTKVGAFLRRANLDELPQFFNVLRGEMSIVGPRPERPFFVEKFIKEVARYNSRHYLKAGVTGWAQVNGWRGDTSIGPRVEHDLYYLRHWSLLFDFKIMFLTVWRWFGGNTNAY